MTNTDEIPVEAQNGYANAMSSQELTTYRQAQLLSLQVVWLYLWDGRSLLMSVEPVSTMDIIRKLAVLLPLLQTSDANSIDALRALFSDDTRRYLDTLCRTTPEWYVALRDMVRMTRRLLIAKAKRNQRHGMCDGEEEDVDSLDEEDVMEKPKDVKEEKEAEEQEEPQSAPLTDDADDLDDSISEDTSVLSPAESLPVLLHAAHILGLSTGMHGLLQLDVSPDVADDEGITALMWAVEGDFVPAVQQLLEAGADVSARDDRGRTALTWASCENKPASIDALLAAGADVSAMDNRGNAVAHYAATYDRHVVLKKLLFVGAEDIPAAVTRAQTAVMATETVPKAVIVLQDATVEAVVRDPHADMPSSLPRRPTFPGLRLRGLVDVEQRCEVTRRTPLLFACWKGNVRATRVLLAAGADVHAEDIDGTKAMHFAAAKGKLQLLRTLLAAGASVNVRNHDKETPLMMAAEFGHPAAVQYLLAHGADVTARDAMEQTAMLHCLQCCNPDIVHMLMAAGLPLYAVDDSGETSLMRVAKHSDDVCLRLLLRTREEGAWNDDLDARDDRGNTALMFALMYKNTANAALLLKAGASPNVANNDEITPLMLAVKKRTVDAVQLLMGAKADVHQCDRDGNDALMVAADNKCIVIMRLLLAAGGNVKHVNRKGKHALMIAVQGKDVESIRVLLGAGADVDLRVARMDGRTALMSAAKAGNANVVAELLARGADVDVVDSKGATALTYAARKKGKVLKMLLNAKRDTLFAQREEYDGSHEDFDTGTEDDDSISYDDDSCDSDNSDYDEY